MLITAESAITITAALTVMKKARIKKRRCRYFIRITSSIP